MKHRSHILLGLLLVTLAMFSGCRPQRGIIPAAEEALSAPIVALNTIHSNHARFESYTARFTGTATWQGSRHTVSGAIRMLHDRAIWISVAPVMGIEISRVIVTPDSVRFLNRLDATYFTGDIRFLNQLIGSNMDFYMLQAVLLGNDFSHFNHQSIELLNDREMLRLNFSERERNPSDGFRITQSLWIDPITYRLRQSNVSLPQYAQQMHVQYHALENISGQQLPVSMHISLAAESSVMELSLQLSRIQLNTPVELTFTIPTRYRKIEM